VFSIKAAVAKSRWHTVQCLQCYHACSHILTIYIIMWLLQYIMWIVICTQFAINICAENSRLKRRKLFLAVWNTCGRPNVGHWYTVPSLQGNYCEKDFTLV